MDAAVVVAAPHAAVAWRSRHGCGARSASALRLVVPTGCPCEAGERNRQVALAFDFVLPAETH